MHALVIHSSLDMFNLQVFWATLPRYHLFTLEKQDYLIAGQTTAFYRSWHLGGRRQLRRVSN